jgi:hypothetical protein
MKYDETMPHDVPLSEQLILNPKKKDGTPAEARYIYT